MKIEIDVPNISLDSSRIIEAIIHTRGMLTLEEAASMINLSPTWFSRKAKDLLGMSYRRAVIIYPLRLGAELLRRGVPIKEVAAELNYVDATTFARAFKREFGFTPKLYTLQPAVPAQRTDGSSDSSSPAIPLFSANSD
jgi:AraC-like DNA-binding protein